MLQESRLHLTLADNQCPATMHSQHVTPLHTLDKKMHCYLTKVSAHEAGGMHGLIRLSICSLHGSLCSLSYLEAMEHLE